MGLEHPDIRADSPYNKPETVTVPAGSKATVTYSPENSDTTFVLPELSVTKAPDTTYQLKLDSVERYEGSIPPTDIDDSTQTFIPAWTFGTSMQVIVRNFGSNERTYHVQAKGWETTDAGGGN